MEGKISTENTNVNSSDEFSSNHYHHYRYRDVDALMAEMRAAADLVTDTQHQHEEEMMLRVIRPFLERAKSRG